MSVLSQVSFFLLRTIATLGPIGHLPKAPGTWGSCAALCAAPWLFLPLHLEARLLVLTVLFLVGGIAAGCFERESKCQDPGQVVIDEVLGQWTTLCFVAQAQWWALLLALVLFRILDICKPWPIRASESWLPGGFSVMIDDFLAGLIAAGLLALGGG